MKKEKTSKDFIIKPHYPGGPKALSTFIYKHLKYPPEALDQKIEGTVVIVIDIDHHGKVINSRIKQSLGHGCDEAASEVVRLLKFQLDQVVRRGRTIFHKTLNIHFRLPNEVPQKTSIKYTVIPNKKEEPHSNPSSYHYTIKW